MIVVLLPLLLMSFLSVGQYIVSADITTDLEGWWKLDEGTGSVGVDSSGNTNHAVITGSTWVAGKYGYGLNSSSDASQYFRVSYLNTLKSIAFWYNFTDAHLSNQAVYSDNLDAVGTTGNSFMHQGSNDWQVYFDLGNGTTLRFRDANTDIDLIGDGTYHHTVIVLEANYTCSFYSDGVLAINIASDYSDVTDSNTYTYFGCRGGGSLDDIRVYSRVLTVSDVTELYAYNPSATPSPSPTSTPFPEGAMDDTDWWISILVLLLIIINIFLMMLPFALVRFVFGILSLFLCMLALSYQIPLSPYLQTAGLLISALAMLFSVRARE